MYKITKMENNDGVTLVNGAPVVYHTGYQVATCGVECRNIDSANKAIAAYGGNCGVWYSDGIYYIDKSHRVKKLKKARRIARTCHQQSILKWDDMSLIWIKNQP